MADEYIYETVPEEANFSESFLFRLQGELQLPHKRIASIVASMSALSLKPHIYPRTNLFNALLHTTSGFSYPNLVSVPYLSNVHWIPEKNFSPSPGAAWSENGSSGLGPRRLSTVAAASLTSRSKLSSDASPGAQCVGGIRNGQACCAFACQTCGGTGCSQAFGGRSVAEIMALATVPE